MYITYIKIGNSVIMAVTPGVPKNSNSCSSFSPPPALVFFVFLATELSVVVLEEAADLLALEGRPRRAVPFGVAVAVALVVEVGVSVVVVFGGRICDVDGDVSVESAPPTPDLRPRAVRRAVPGVSTKPGCSVFLP